MVLDPDTVKRHEARLYDRVHDERLTRLGDPRNYPDHVASDRYRESVFADYLRRLPRPKRAADIGTGQGTWAVRLARYADEVTGVDISEQILQTASRDADGLGLSNVSFVQGDGENIALPGGIFDVVTHFSLLSYLPNPNRGLAEAHRLLCPGGHLILDTVSADWWMLPLYLKRWRPRHALTRPISTASMREILAERGFEVLDFKYCWSAVDFPISAVCGAARRYRALSFVLPLARAYYAGTFHLGRRLGNGTGLRWLFRQYIVLARKSI